MITKKNTSTFTLKKNCFRESIEMEDTWWVNTLVLGLMLIMRKFLIAPNKHSKVKIIFLMDGLVNSSNKKQVDLIWSYLKLPLNYERAFVLLMYLSQHQFILILFRNIKVIHIFFLESLGHTRQSYCLHNASPGTL